MSTYYHLFRDGITGEFDSDDIQDLGYHCSSTIRRPRMYFRNYTNLLQINVDLSKGPSITIHDQDDWRSLECMQDIILAINKEYNLRSIRETYNYIKSCSNNNHFYFSENLRNWLISNYDVRYILYRDEIDGFHDDCICILDPSIILDYKNISDQY